MIEILKSTATDLKTGSGLLNMAAAIHLAKATQPEAYQPDLQVVPTTWSGEGTVTPLERAARVAYNLKQGETLWGIAARELGDGVYTDLSKAIFGYRVHMNTGYAYDQGYRNYYGKWHAGIDMGAPAGTPIKAVVGGTVRWVNSDFMGIDGDDGNHWVYGHLGTKYVSSGKRIEAGTTLARLDSANHLHLEVQHGHGYKKTNGAHPDRDFVRSVTISPLQAYWQWKNRNGNSNQPSQPSNPSQPASSLLPLKIGVLEKHPLTQNMLPQFYQTVLETHLSLTQYLTLQLLILLVQSHRTVSLSRLAQLFPQPIKYERRPRISKHSTGALAFWLEHRLCFTSKKRDLNCR